MYIWHAYFVNNMTHPLEDVGMSKTHIQSTERIIFGALIRMHPVIIYAVISTHACCVTLKYNI